MNSDRNISGKWAGCTVAAFGEIAQATVVAQSFLTFNPDAEFAVLVVSPPDERVTVPGAKILTLRDLGLPVGDEWRLPMLFSMDEIVALANPMLVEALFGTGHDAVAYFSPATEIFAAVTDVLRETASSTEIIATPPIQNDNGDSGRSFLAVGLAARSIGQQWRDRMRAEVDARIASSSYVGSNLNKVFDAVAHRVIALPGFAINYSSLNPSSLTCHGHSYKVKNEPLRSFDFRGYDPAKPHWLSRYLGLEPHILLSEHPCLAELCHGYRKELVRASGIIGLAGSNSVFETLPSGLKIDLRMRRTYRGALREHKAGLGDEPPSPFGAAGEKGFLAWLNEPLDKVGAGVTRYMLAVYEDRGDVQNAFPNPLEDGAVGFSDWYRVFGSRELQLPDALVPGQRKTEVVDTPAISCTQPVNVAGYFRAELGIGVAGRAVLAALDTTDVPVNTVSFDRTANRLNHPFTERHFEGVHADTNIVCVNPDQIDAFAEQTGPEFWNGRYSIGVWFWEAEDFPASLHHAFNYVDEIWVASDFMRQTFLKVSPKSVFKYRLPVLAPPIDRSITRAQLKLPDKFTFLFSFDFLSVLERKNPLGLIEAFTRAFPSADGPCLVIKTINGDKRILEMEKLKYAVRGRSDIVLMDGYLPAVENATFASLADCYVSLHRSEGFGLTIAEAMALGKPVIATDYSGNREFMTPENSYLCSASRTQIGPEREPYPAQSYWCEPDLTAAAGLLRHVYENPAEASARGRRAAEDIRARHSSAVAGRIICDRLITIRRRRADPGPIRSAGFLQDRIDELEAQAT